MKRLLAILLILALFVGALGIGAYGACTEDDQVFAATPMITAEAGRMALNADGTVSFWQNDLSVIYNPVPHLNRVVAISGYTALRDDGTVWTLHWLHHSNHYIFVQVPGLSDMVSIGSTVLNSFALCSNGMLYRIVSLTAGHVWYERPAHFHDVYFTTLLDGGIAIDDQGAAWDITRHNRLMPLIGDWGDVIQMEPGLVLHADGTVWEFTRTTQEHCNVCHWCEREWGCINPGYYAVEFTQVSGLANITSIATTGFSFPDDRFHALALCESGAVWAWGSNRYGQLGIGLDGRIASWRDTPVLVLGLDDAVAIGATVYQSLAMRADGSVWAWGDANDARSAWQRVVALLRNIISHIFRDEVRGSAITVPTQVNFTTSFVARVVIWFSTTWNRMLDFFGLLSVP